MMMRKILLAGAMLGLVMGVAAPMTARALTIGPASLSAPAADNSMVVQVRRGGGVAWRGPRGGGVAWRGPRGRGGVAWRGGRRGGVAWRGPVRGGVAWRGPVRGGVAWRGGWRRPGWRVGWVGPGFYYNPAFYNRYYNPRWGYCRIVTWNGGRVCRWYRRPWW
jgi:hypothetical protein